MEEGEERCYKSEEWVKSHGQQSQRRGAPLMSGTRSSSWVFHEAEELTVSTGLGGHASRLTRLVPAWCGFDLCKDI